MGSAVCGNNAIIFGNLDGDIYALSSSGNLLWTYKTGGRVNTPAIGTKLHNIVKNYSYYCYFYYYCSCV